MLNYIWLGLMVFAVIIGGWNGCLDQAIKGAFDMAKSAVMDVALPLSAIMTIWLGIMRLAEKSGLVLILAGGLRPVLRRLFPEVPPNHPAMGSMVMNIAANMLGLGNAATPLGLRAMTELQKLNPYPGTASNAMCTFLAINTASIQLIPATAIGILAVKGASNPTAIVGTAFLATVCAQATGLTAVKIFEKMRIFRVRPELETTNSALPKEAEPVHADSSTENAPQAAPLTIWGRLLLIGFFAFFVLLFVDLAFPKTNLFGRDSTTLSLSNFRDMESFVTKLKQPSDGVSTNLNSKLSEETRQALATYQVSKSNLEQLRKPLIKEMNAVIKGGSLYDAQQFSNVKMRSETKQLIEQNPQGENLARLNRLLLEDAYPSEILRKPEGLFPRIITSISLLAIPFFLSFFPLYAALRRIKVYEEFVEGAKEGFGVAVRIIPYLVAILAAVGMFRGAGGIEIIARLFKPLLEACQFPPELLSLALLRPLSGSGSIALVTDVVKTYGPDHIYSMMAGTILGSTETTFYVLAVYFGSVGIRRTRHAVAAGLLADAVGIIASVIFCRLLFSAL